MTEKVEADTDTNQADRVFVKLRCRAQEENMFGNDNDLAMLTRSKAPNTN